MPVKIRVLQLTVGFTVGGAELLIRDLCRFIDQEQFDVKAACLKGPGPVGTEIRKTGAQAIPLGGGFRFNPLVLRRLYRLLRTEKFHIVHSHLFYGDMAGRLVGRLARVPVVINTQHDTDLWMRRRHIFASKATLSLADRVVAVSQNVLDDTVARLRVPRTVYRVIHNGVDLERFGGEAQRDVVRRGLGLPEHGAIIGFVGRLLDSKKGVSVLLKAFSRMTGEASNHAVLVLVGDGPDRLSLEATAADLGLGDRVVFLGERSGIASLYKAFDVLAVPSLYEGFGLVCIEGMAACLPVVASRVGGIPEIVLNGETGCLVQPKDPEALAMALMRYLEKPALAAEHGAAGRARVESFFTIQKMVRSYESLYQELIS